MHMSRRPSDDEDDDGDQSDSAVYKDAAFAPVQRTGLHRQRASVQPRASAPGIASSVDRGGEEEQEEEGVVAQPPCSPATFQRIQHTARAALATLGSHSRTLRVLLATTLLYLVFNTVFLVYGAIARASGSGATVGSIALLVGGTFVAIAACTVQFVQAVPYEYSYLALLLWVIVGSLYSDVCICCASSSSSSSRPAILAAACATPGGFTIPVAAFVSNITYAAIVALVYAVSQRYLSPSNLFQTVRSRIFDDAKARAAPSVAMTRQMDSYYMDEEMMSAAAEGDQIRADASLVRGIKNHADRILLLVLGLAAALIPLECNNAQRIPYLQYGLRVIGFLCVFLLRLVNDHARHAISRQWVELPAIIAKHIFEAIDPSADLYSARLLPHERDIVQQYHSEMKRKIKNNFVPYLRVYDAAPAKSPSGGPSDVATNKRVEQYNAYMRELWVVELMQSLLISATSLILCEWLLLFIGAQLLYELRVYVQNRHERYNIADMLRAQLRLFKRQRQAP